MLDYELLAQTVFTEINLIRHLPHLAIPSLTDRLQYFNHFIYSHPNYEPVDTAEGKIAVKECIDFLRVQKSLPLVSMHKQLTAAARSLAIDFTANHNNGAIYESGSTA
jgi:hypothetical protein